MSKTAKIFFHKLKEIFDRAESAIRKWEQTDGPDVSYQGVLVKAIAPAMDLEFRRLIDASADEGREVEDSLAKQAIMALDSFALEYARWVRAVGNQADSPRGNGRLWSAWSRVRAAFEPIHNEKPRSLKYLVEAAGAPRSQICRMYGWVDEHGEPQMEKIDEEMAKPGTHYDEKKWKSPAYVARLAQIDRDFADRQGSRKMLWPDMNDPDGEAAKKSTVAPPTVEEMLAAGAPASQIARVHGMAIEKAEELVKDHQEFKALEAVEKANAQKFAGAGA